MSGLLSGLAGLGLGNLENMDIFERPEKEEAADESVIVEAKPQEKDFVFDKVTECPVCGKSFSVKIMKTGKAKLLGTDLDLRPRYAGVDAVKYDIILCTKCGYAALGRFFPNITMGQAKLIRENISKSVRLNPYDGEIYTYDEAIERYKLTLANAVVKRARVSEKAYICLKSAWLMRGYAEHLEELGQTDKIADIKAQEEQYIQNAFNGFVEARNTENFPMCGMDEGTIDYLLAVLAMRLKKYDVSAKLIGNILTSTAGARTKDKARELKEQLLLEVKKSKA